jgi:hypothetical protein
MAKKGFTVAPNICGYSVWKLFHVTLLAPRILMWHLDFLKKIAPPRFTSREGRTVSIG